jgi:TolB-like protein/tetratricopeptide (TPR) repeat protein
MEKPSAIGFLKELRRRRVFRVAGLYVIGVWVLMQAANILFPAWGIPDAAIRFLLWAGLLGFPLALAFGWVFDVTTDGIRRTQPVSSAAELQHSLPLRRADYLILAAFLVVMGALVYDTSGRVMETATRDEWRPATVEIDPNSVAVLPFADLSPERDQEYFTDGISEEILNRLSAFRELKVIGRTSSFAFKNSNYDIARISGLLAVKYLLQGSVRRDGQQLRIAAQLVDSAGVQVWTSTFDRELGAIFALQDEIAEAVATSIVPQIVPPSTVEERLPDLEAYEEYLIGHELMARRTPGWFFNAPARFDRAIELDPQFAQAYAARALMLMLAAGFPGIDYHPDRVQQDIDTAQALDPDLATAHAAQGLLMMRLNIGGHADREAVMRRAVTLDPNFVEALGWLSGMVRAQERHDEADELLHKAVRIDPLAPRLNLYLVDEDQRRGRLAEAERRLLRQLAVPQPSMVTYEAMRDHYRTTGRKVEALEAAKRFVLAAVPAAGRIGPGFGLVLGYAELGLRSQAEHWHDRWDQSWPERPQIHLFRFTSLELLAGHRGYNQALAAARAMLESAGASISTTGGWDWHAGDYGLLQALSGDHEGAIGTLEPLVDWKEVVQPLSVDARHGLAWAYQRTGALDKAAALLEPLDQHFRQQQASDRLHLSDDLFNYARNTLLLGDRARALDYFGQAVDAGWRGYYGLVPDPRWDSVREHARFVALMAAVKADLDAQRARVEAIDAEDDFEARLDAALAAQQAPSSRP